MCFVGHACDDIDIPVPRVNYNPRILLGISVQREIGKYLQVALVVVEGDEVGGIDVRGNGLESLEEHIGSRTASTQPRC